ncbi:hypothetical protein H9P43_006114 [Blastocladiella emersonii ATCC 22665]|nr:hypothetical protein H9P43_006114 [Blastocladiella emersonii ATCC 22665]
MTVRNPIIRSETNSSTSRAAGAHGGDSTTDELAELKARLAQSEAKTAAFIVQLANVHDENEKLKLELLAVRVELSTTQLELKRAKLDLEIAQGSSAILGKAAKTPTTTPAAAAAEVKPKQKQTTAELEAVKADLTLANSHIELQGVVLAEYNQERQEEFFLAHAMVDDALHEANRYSDLTRESMLRKMQEYARKHDKAKGMGVFEKRSGRWTAPRSAFPAALRHLGLEMPEKYRVGLQLN